MTTQDFGWAIAPLTPDTFFQDIYERSHVVVRRNDPDYYSGLLTLADIDRVVSTTAPSPEDLRMVKAGSPIPTEDIALASGAIDPVRVARAFAEGGTIVLNGLQRRLPQLAAYCRALEQVFSCDLQTNIYLTPDNAQGFKTHYDSHDVIVLQIAGSKTWRIYGTPVELPLRGQPFRADGFEPGPVTDTFVLHAGDMAYVPRGLVHDAIATDEVSLHITTGLLSRRWIDLVLEAIAQEALADPAFRRSLPPGYVAPGFDRTAARETFRDLIARVADRADPDRALDTFAKEYRGARIPAAPGQLDQVIRSAAIAPGTAVGARPHLIWELAEEAPETPDAEPRLRLEVQGSEIVFPGRVRAALEHALSAPRYRVGELPGDLDAEGQAVLVRRLVREGLALRLD